MSDELAQLKPREELVRTPQSLSEPEHIIRLLALCQCMADYAKRPEEELMKNGKRYAALILRSCLYILNESDLASELSDAERAKLFALLKTEGRA